MPVLLAAVAAGALLTIVGEERGRRPLVYVCKPATTLLILAAAALAPGAAGTYRLLVVVGLACSLAGDVFLMLPRDRFLHGLASFLVAHLAYGSAFAVLPRGTAPWAVLGLLVAVGGTVLALLWPGLGGRLRGPVVVYVAAILGMVWMAAARWIQTDAAGAGRAAAGAVFFLVSDTLLALDRFRAPFPGARAAVLATYYAGQTLIALSTG